jgi:hypothetical protein
MSTLGPSSTNLRAHTRQRRMILCAGLQSGGTTAISWCFLQRHDTNGVLDMANDIIYTSFEKVQEPVVWCKMTVGSFRWLDVHDVYHDLGWEPQPLLVVRDARMAFSSLCRKRYGFNGTTAEEPPLRLRFRRFLQDWELFRAKDWPILVYEDFLRDPQTTLANTCHLLQLPWDDAMVTWPKHLSELAYVDKVNASFLQSIQCGSLHVSIAQMQSQPSIVSLSSDDLQWLEKTFTTYNRFHGYADHIEPLDTPSGAVPLSAPRFEGTARSWFYEEVERLRTENDRLWLENEALREEHNQLRQQESKQERAFACDSDEVRS